MMNKIILTFTFLLSVFGTHYVLSDEIAVDRSNFVPTVSFQGCDLCIWVDIEFDPDYNKALDQFRYCLGKSNSKPEDLLLLSKSFSQTQDLFPLIKKLEKKDKKLANEFYNLLEKSLLAQSDVSLFAKSLLDLLIQLEHEACTQKELDVFLEKNHLSKEQVE